MGEELEAGGWGLSTGGTDTHLVLADLRGIGWTGKDAEERLDRGAASPSTATRCRSTTQPPMVTSGVRVGMAAMTTRGFDEAAARETGRIMVGNARRGADIDALAERAAALLADFPLYTDLEDGLA